ncbi:MAG: TIGR01777 family oxidoreductase [Gemmatimonadota bacterium]
MSLDIVRVASDLPVSQDELWDWHLRRGALGRLLPPWERVRIVQQDRGVDEGNRTTVHVGIGPAGVDWVSEHAEPDPPRSFADFQVEGPFAKWSHRHQFTAREDGGCEVEDRIEYELPLEPIAGLVGGRAIRERVRRGIGYRHRVLRRDFERHRNADLAENLGVAVSGASGMVGTALARVLSTGGHRPLALARASSTPPNAVEGSIDWDIGAGTVDSRALDGLAAVVHLAGESIADGRWTDERKRAILDSRVEGTKLLAETLAALDDPPPVLVCASAIGYYGDRAGARIDETAAPGSGFLSDVVTAWEDAAQPARDAGIRVVHLRFGMILWPGGGALERLLIPMRAGVGGKIGSGRQIWSWVSLDDVIGAVLHAIGRDEVRGPVNVTAPGAVSNQEFTSVLAGVLNRPAVVPAPEFALKVALGSELAEELLLASADVKPTRLAESGYVFADPELEPALRHMLGRYPAS